MTKPSRRVKAHRRDVEELLVQAEAKGCRVKGGHKGRHFQILLPDGLTIVTLAGSPSDRRAVPNTRAKLERRLGPLA